MRRLKVSDKGEDMCELIKNLDQDTEKTSIDEFIFTSMKSIV